MKDPVRIVSGVFKLRPCEGPAGGEVFHLELRCNGRVIKLEAMEHLTNAGDCRLFEFYESTKKDKDDG